MTPTERVLVLLLGTLACCTLAIGPAAFFLAHGRFGSGADIINWVLGL